MSYYEQLLKQKGLKLSEEARIARAKLREGKAPTKIRQEIHDTVERAQLRQLQTKKVRA